MAESAHIAVAEAPAPIIALQQAFTNGDARLTVDLWADDVVFHSPLTNRVAFTGAAEVAALHEDILSAIANVRVSPPVVDGRRGTFVITATVDGRALEVVYAITVNPQNRIVEATVYGRPFPAVAALFSDLPPRVVRRRRGRMPAKIVRILTLPILGSIEFADRIAPRFI